MAYRRILTIQDISCVGQCSMTVALPILSACGHETCILPAAVLSTHTGGFGKPAVTNLTDSMDAIWRHWQREGIRFDAIYTGYLGSIEAIETASQIMDALLAPDGKIIVDPAMADHGKLYSGFDSAYAEAMTGLCREADIILPNITEACMMTGHPYREKYDAAYIAQLMDQLSRQNHGVIVLTGVSFEPGETGAMLREKGKDHYYSHEKIPQSYHGTGDIFASAFVGACMQGKTCEEAVRIAADFTALCIHNTYQDPAHWYGVKFETALPSLIRMLE